MPQTPGRRAKASRLRERAYVKASHREPGLDLQDDGMCKVKLEIKNFGCTPATVTRVQMKRVIRHYKDLLPAVPDYDTESAQKEGSA